MAGEAADGHRGEGAGPGESTRLRPEPDSESDFPASLACSRYDDAARWSEATSWEADLLRLFLCVHVSSLSLSAHMRTATPEGHSLVAIGHEDGLWIGLRHDPSSFRLVVHLKLITQVTVLQEFALVLVLADKALYAYPLEALVPSVASAAFQREKDPQKISGAKDVLFFRAGKVGPRLLVIYVKKSGVNQNVFKALEPIASSERSNRTLLKRKPDWFRTYKARLTSLSC